MLISIHNKLKGWVSSVIIGGIIVVFAFWGLSNYITSGLSSRVVATVDGADISHTDFSNLYQGLAERQALYTKQTGMPPLLDDVTLRNRALDALIQERAMMNKINAEHYAVSEQAVQQWLQHSPEFQEDGRFSKARFTQIANQYNLSERTLFNKIRESIVIEQLPQGINLSSFVLENEAEPLYRLSEQKRSVGYMVVDASKFYAQSQPSAPEIQAYYDEHKAEFMTPERLQLQYVKLSPQQAAMSISISDAEAQAYYDEHQENYQSLASWQVAHILLADQEQATKLFKQLQGGADFAKLAAAHSKDSVTAKRGGDLGVVFAGELPAPLEQAIEQLTLDNALSQPVKTDFGYHIVKLYKIQPATVKDMAIVKPEIVETLQQQRANELYSQWLEDLAAMAFESSGSLQEVAAQFNVPVEQTDWISRDGDHSGIAASPAVLQAAFTTEVLVDGNNSEVIQLPDHDAVVIRVAKHEPSRAQTLTEATPKVVKALTAAEAAKRAHKQGTAIVAQLQDGRQGDDVAKIAGLDWIHNGNLSRRDGDLLPAIRDQAFALKANQVAGFALADGDYAVVKLEQVLPATIGDQDPEYDDFKLSMRKLLANIDYSMYNSAVLANAKVERFKFNRE